MHSSVSEIAKYSSMIYKPTKNNLSNTKKSIDKTGIICYDTIVSVVQCKYFILYKHVISFL